MSKVDEILFRFKTLGYAGCNYTGNLGFFKMLRETGTSKWKAKVIILIRFLQNEIYPS